MTTTGGGLLFYISAHGFGHATRDLEVINRIIETRPDMPIAVRSAVPRWFLDQALHGAFVLLAGETDTGMVQVDSLTLDVAATLEHARAFYADFPARVDDEAAALQPSPPAAIVGDIPPLAFAVARRVGVPGIALGNFTWDWIYAHYPEFVEESDVLATVRDAYASASRALRLPFCGGFEPMAAVTTDIPLIGRRSRCGRDVARRALGLNADRPIVLASFGGYHTSLPFEAIVQRNDITLLVTSHELPAVSPEVRDRLRLFDRHDLTRRGLRYEDLVAAADVVVTKPGYGIVSECVANDTAVLYTSRGPFIEHDLFVEAMPRVLRCRFIEQEDLRAGQWEASVAALLSQPSPPEKMPADGADTACRLILETVLS